MAGRSGSRPRGTRAGSDEARPPGRTDRRSSTRIRARYGARLERTACRAQGRRTRGPDRLEGGRGVAGFSEWYSAGNRPPPHDPQGDPRLDELRRSSRHGRLGVGWSGLVWPDQRRVLDRQSARICRSPQARTRISVEGPAGLAGGNGCMDRGRRGARGRTDSGQTERRRCRRASGACRRRKRQDRAGPSLVADRTRVGAPDPWRPGRRSRAAHGIRAGDGAAASFGPRCRSR